MPILPAEPDLFPPTLFGDTLSFPTDGRLWRALHTKPRQEKSLARQLHQSQMAYYLPMIARPCLVRGRRVTSYVPLFPGYCFVLGNDQERIKALATGRVVRSLEVPDQGQLWDDLRQVNTLIRSGAPITPEGHMVPGTPVEIHTGALAGLHGVIIRRANQHRLVIQVDFLQRGASVELEDFMVAKAV
jgi:transcription antitermination factor NusG